MADDLHGLNAGVLKVMTHAELSEAPRQIAGLVVPNADGLSMRQRILLALANLIQVELDIFVIEFAVYRGDIGLDEVGRKVLGAGDPPAAHITRPDVARVFGDDLAGKRGTVGRPQKSTMRSESRVRVSAGPQAQDACICVRAGE